MSGVVFIVCIPTEIHELTLRKDRTKRVTINEPSKFIKSDIQPENSRNTSKDANVENESMEKVLLRVLNELNINYSWCSGKQSNYWHVIFSASSNERCDEILEMLKDNYIGQRCNSTVNVLPCTVQFNSQQGHSILEQESFIEDVKDSAWHTFLTSIRARLTVAQVVENMKIHATLTFDFIFLILVSTIMCAIGLVENSNVYLLSSMVICPMMAPVMAGTFGSVIHNKNLMKIGVQNELIGLGLATVVGFCYGAVICSVTEKISNPDENRMWPTYEMLSRSEVRSLWVGSLIALLAGAVVALGVLSDNVASLVGVAISTSLTPPAVNAGLFWSLPLVYYIKGDETYIRRNLTLYNYYSQNPIIELLALGGVSMCLTFVNIICIYVASIIVFKIKEVAPISSKDHVKRNFWKYDIKIARDYNKTVQYEENSCMIHKLNEDLARYRKTSLCNDHLCQSTDFQDDIPSLRGFKRREYTWSPCMEYSRNLDIKELSEVYNKLVKNIPMSSQPSSPHMIIKQDPHHYRRLSQIFVKEEEKDKLSTISESGKDGYSSDVSNNSRGSLTDAQSTSGKKKFIVTPCKPDVP